MLRGMSLNGTTVTIMFFDGYDVVGMWVVTVAVAVAAAAAAADPLGIALGMSLVRGLPSNCSRMLPMCWDEKLVGLVQDHVAVADEAVDYDAVEH